MCDRLSPSNGLCAPLACVVKGGLKQIGCGQAAIGPPPLGQLEDLSWCGEMTERVDAPNTLAQGKISWQHHVWPVERDDQKPLHGPGPDAWNGRELRLDVLI